MNYANARKLAKFISGKKVTMDTIVVDPSMKKHEPSADFIQRAKGRFTCNADVLFSPYNFQFAFHDVPSYMQLRRLIKVLRGEIVFDNMWLTKPTRVKK